MNEKRVYTLYDRERLEAIEASTLAPYAKRSAGVHATRNFEESEHPYRTAFQRDRDRIIHSRAFRRLKHKRQVFLTSESDHYRTRITHTLEVAQLSRTMARALGLNEDLVEAIALGHDLGHTPFGHLGEVVLNRIMIGSSCFSGQTESVHYGGFKHNYQSVRIVDHLEKKYVFPGLNLTAPVREGILKHTRLKRDELNFQNFIFDGLRYDQDVSHTLEGQVVAICDEIAQRTHDLEDGMRAGLADADKVRRLQIVNLVEEKRQISNADSSHPNYRDWMIRGLINYLVRDVIENTLTNIQRFEKNRGEMAGFDQEIVCFSDESNPIQKELNKFIYKEIIDFSRVNWADEIAEKLIFRLFEAYYQDPMLLPGYVIARYLSEASSWTVTEAVLHPDEIPTIRQDSGFFRTICDHIAGMTDHFALHEAERLAELKKLDAHDLQLEVAWGKRPATL
ncbi:dNTP triphosphohydrolase [bacterium]|nr:dNTP triphosphohydrolase [bacterium]